MKHWLFRPIVFYPLAALIAAAVVIVSLDPFSWQGKPRAVGGRVESGAIILEAEALSAPGSSPEQTFTVVREGFGKVVALNIAVLPQQPPPTPAETGVRILLAPEAIALIEDRPVRAVVDYRTLPVNPASGLAVSIQGIGPADWIEQDVPVGQGELTFNLPAQFAVESIGLRALSDSTELNSGLEIVSIRLEPQNTDAAPAPPG